MESFRFRNDCLPHSVEQALHRKKGQRGILRVPCHRCRKIYDQGQTQRHMHAGTLSQMRYCRLEMQMMKTSSLHNYLASLVSAVYTHPARTVFETPGFAECDGRPVSWLF